MKKKLLLAIVLLAGAVAAANVGDGDPPPDCPPVGHCVNT